MKNIYIFIGDFCWARWGGGRDFFMNSISSLFF